MAKFYDEFYRQEETGHDELVIRCITDESIRGKIIPDTISFKGQMQVLNCGSKHFPKNSELPIYLVGKDGDITKITKESLQYDKIRAEILNEKDCCIYQNQTYTMKDMDKLIKCIPYESTRNELLKEFYDNPHSFKNFKLRWYLNDFYYAKKKQDCFDKDTCNKKDSCKWLNELYYKNEFFISERKEVEIKCNAEYKYQTEVVCRNGSFIVGYADLLFSVRPENPMKNLKVFSDNVEISPKFYNKNDSLLTYGTNEFSILVEVKPQIKDVGSITRQLKTYRELLSQSNIEKTVIVTYSDISDGARMLLKNEGIDCITVER